jgi:hypothetical protein
VLLICSPVGLLVVSQAGLELLSGDAGALLFSQVMWYREALYGLGVQDVKALTLLGDFFLPASQQKF